MPPFQTTVALLEACRGVVRGFGSERLIVVIFPTQGDMNALVAGRELAWRTLLTRLDELRIQFVDGAAALAAAARAHGVETLYLESHLSPRGNELIAEAVRAALAP